MSIESKLGAAKTAVTLVGVGVAGYVAYKVYSIYEDFKLHPEKYPALAGTLGYWGIGVKPGDRIQNISPDSTIGAAGAAELKAVAGPNTVYAYDQALSAFALNHGFPNGATAAASDQWPADPSIGNDLGFTDWKNQGFPELPV